MNDFIIMCVFTLCRAMNLFLLVECVYFDFLAHFSSNQFTNSIEEMFCECNLLWSVCRYIDSTNKFCGVVFTFYDNRTECATYKIFSEKKKYYQIWTATERENKKTATTTREKKYEHQDIYVDSATEQTYKHNQNVLNMAIHYVI